jgi:cell division protein ZapE
LPDPDASQGAVSRAYAARVRQGVLSDDPAQRAACHVLDGIVEALERTARPAGLKSLFGRSGPVGGAYLVGDVGRGKTMLMDLFCESAPVPRRRVHFHQFMAEIHAAITVFRRKAKGRKDDADPIAAVTKPIIKSIRLLCLDEFHVHDITNAMLLQRLFEQLFAGGVTLVATSNVAPERLYENGLNRQLFLPFIDLLQRHAEVVHLDGPTDYRRLKFSGQQVYFFGDDAEAGLERLWRHVTGGVAAAPAEVQLLGRKLNVPRTALGAAWFDFSELCEKPLGARDYLRLAEEFDTLFIAGIPRLDRTRSDAAKRLIVLIDTLYDRGIKLAASFAAPLDAIGADERTAFEFARTVSRLTEMRSDDYLTAPRRAA